MPSCKEIDAQITSLSDQQIALTEDASRPWADRSPEFDKLEDQIKGLEAKRATVARTEGLAALGDATGSDGFPPAGTNDGEVKSLGRYFVDTVGRDKFADVKGSGQRWHLSSPEYGQKELAAFVKALDNPMTTGTLVPANDPSMVDYVRRVIETPLRRPVVASLMASGTVSNPSFSYHVQDSAQTEGGYAYVAEGATKPAMSFGFTAVTESLRKIAGIYKLTDEALEDLDYLASIINSQALTRLGLFEENELLNGAGAGHIIGLLNRSGIQTVTVTAPTAGQEGSANADGVFDASTKIETATLLPADGLVINPADYQKFRLSRDGNGQYYGGGYFAGQYGVGGIQEAPPLWGLRTIVTPVIAAGTALVGAFGTSAQVFRKGGIRVDSTNSNEDDFTNNRVAFRVEERVGLACYIPAAFCKVTFDWTGGA